MPSHDLVILGTGSGNSILTPEFDDLDTAVVEHGRFGGTCLNTGCIPTKMLVLPADRVVEAQDAARLGVGSPRPVVHWPSVRDRVFGRVDGVADSGEAYRRSQSHVTVYAGTARFIGPRRLALSTGEEVTGDRVVVGAGSRPNGLPVDGLRHADPARGVHTSETVMRLDALPPRMAVLGGGYVGCELAHVFAAYGVEVTQVQRSDRLLVHEDEHVSRRYTEVAAGRVDLRLSTTVRSATREGGVWSLDLTGAAGATRVEAEVVLIAAGRTPNGDLLDAPAGGLALDPAGRIVVDAEQRTPVPGVWALGDVSSPYQLKHVANHEARVVAHNLAVDLGRVPGPPRRTDHRFVPHAVFGHPQVAAFGPTRAELEAAGTAYVSATYSYGDVAYGWALEDTTGFLTVCADPVTRHVLAAYCVGPEASTLIQPLIQAAAFGQDAGEVARGQYWIHPALSEVVENALLGLRFPGGGR
ncbi:MAG TPA: mycothione reductase [Dermatophilaceae bacterium]|nr:mycothione reductase [Dermatophilaceae bacterium]